MVKMPAIVFLSLNEQHEKVFNVRYKNTPKGVVFIVCLIPYQMPDGAL
jgi:hypothetical protein